MRMDESTGAQPQSGSAPSAAYESQYHTTPDRILSDREYYEWVRERVARGVMVKLGSILGAIGIGGFVIIFTLAYNYYDIMIEKKVTDNVDRKLVSLDETVGSAVAKTLMNHPQISELLNQEAQTAVESDQTKALIESSARSAVQLAVQKEVSPERIQRVAEKAMAEGLEAVLVPKLRRVVIEDQSASATQRGDALRLLTIIMDPQRLRSDLLHILKGAAPSEGELSRIVLQQYRPATIDATAIQSVNAEDAAAIKAALDWLKRTPRNERERADDARLREDYIRFLSRFPDAHTGQLLEFVEKGARKDAIVVVIQALSRMEGDQAIESLVKLVSYRPDPDLQVLAWQGLEQMEPGRKWRSEQNRALALRRLWEAVSDRLLVGQSAVQAARDQLDEFGMLVKPARDSRDALSRLRREAFFRNNTGLKIIYEMLANLGDDWITRMDMMIRQDPMALSEFVEREVERKERENPESKRVSHALANLLRLEDWDPTVQTWIKAAKDDPPQGARRGAVDVLISAWVLRLREGAHITKAEIQKHLPELMGALMVLPDCLYQRGSTQAMNFVIDYGDPETARQFLRQVPELFRGETFPGTENGFLGAEVMLDAFEKASPDPLRELADKIDRDSMRFAGLAPIIARWASRKLDKASDQAIEAYSMAIHLAPERGEYYLGRSRAHLRSNHEEEAGRDLEEALQRNAPVDKGIALEFVQWGDEESARKAVSQSVKASKGAEERAGALENLGLYYIRTSQWQKAFDHTNKVRELSPRKAWNWAVRAIAAHHLELRPEENEARKEWLKTKKIGDLKALRRYIGNETDLLPPEDTGAAPPQ